MDRRNGLQLLSRSQMLSVAGALVLLSLADIAYTQPTTQSGGAEVSQRGQRAAREIKYGDWRKFCFKPAGATMVCRTTISGTWETGQIAVRIDLIEREDGAWACEKVADAHGRSTLLQSPGAFARANRPRPKFFPRVRDAKVGT